MVSKMGQGGEDGAKGRRLSMRKGNRRVESLVPCPCSIRIGIKCTNQGRMYFCRRTGRA